jgi:zinc protease
VRFQTLTVAAGALLAAGCASMLLPTAEPILPPLSYQSYWVGPGTGEYASGLRLKVYEDPNATEVEVAATYAVGARDESSQEHGLAHLVEHLAFDGRPLGAGKPNLWTMISSSADFLNASTNQDRTNYFEMGRPDQLAQFLQWEAWRLRFTLANLEQADFERERDVVLNDFRQNAENVPGGSIDDWVFDNLFPANHPYQHETFGNVKTISALTMEQARSWVKRFYKPDRLTIVVMGPVKGAQVEELVRSTFREATSEPKRAPFTPQLPSVEDILKLKKAETAHFKAPLPHSRVVVFWLVPPGLFDKDARVASVSTQMLSSAVAAGIYDSEMQGQVKASGLGRFRGCGLQPLYGAGIVSCELDLRKDEDAPREIERIKDQLVNIWKGEIAPGGSGHLEELGLLQNVEQAAALESTADFLALGSLPASNLAATIGEYILKTRDHNYIGNWLNNSQRVTKQQVADFAATWLTRERARAIHVSAETDEEFRAHAGKHEVATADLARFVSRNPSAEVVIAASEDEVKAAMPHPNLASAKRVTLKNGLSVVAMRRAGFPVAVTALIVRRDPARATSLDEVIGDLAFRSIRVHRKSLSDIGAEARASSTPDGDAYLILAPAANLPHVLDFLGGFTGTDPMMSRYVPKGAFDSAQDGRAYLETEIPRLFDAQASRNLANLLYGDDVYGTHATAEQIDSVAIGQVDDWIKGNIVPGNATVVVVGDISEDDAVANVDKFLGGWSGASSPMHTVPAPDMPKSHRFAFINRPGATNALISVGLRFPSVDLARSPAAAVFAAELSDRLNNRLREALGITYGYYAGISTLNRGASLLCSGEVENRGVALAAKTVTEFLKDSGHWDAEKLARYKAKEGGRLGFQLSDVVGTANALSGIAMSGLPTT